VTILSNVTSIGAKAFYNCQSLQSFTISDSMNSIGESAFQDCLQLHAVTLGAAVSKIGDSAFENCVSLEEFTFGRSVETIGASAFKGDESLGKVVIPKTVKEIGGSAYEDCINLTSVTFESVSPLEKIAGGTFRNCHSLSAIIIPDSITSIQSYAFSGCSSLESLVIPSSVISIEGSTFEGCSSLKSVVFLGSVEPRSSGGVNGRVNAFGSCDALNYVCVPPDYTSLSFCGKDVYFSSSSLTCEAIYEESNSCYEVIIQDKNTVIVNKRANATEWENQTNDCVEYVCDNESGRKLLSSCQNKDGKTFVCTDDNKCVESKELEEGDEGATVVINMEPTIITDFNKTEFIISLSNLTGVEASKMKIAVELDDKGRVIRIMIYVRDEKTAKIIANKVNDLNKDDCTYGILCRKIDASVLGIAGAVDPLFLAEAPHISNNMWKTVFIAVMIISTSLL